MDVVVVDYLFVIEDEEQSTLVALFIYYIGSGTGAASTDHIMSILEIIIEYPSVIHSHILSVLGLDGRMERLKHFVILLIILLH